MLFNEESKISCIDQSGCPDNEICVKHGDTDVGTCQCSLSFKRNIAGVCILLFIIQFYKSLFKFSNILIQYFFLLLENSLVCSVYYLEKLVKDLKLIISNNYLYLGTCVIMDEMDTAELDVTPQAKIQTVKDTSTSIKPTMKQLLVSAVSKEVRLPENEVTLSAYTVPAERGKQRYNYAWSLLSQPEGHTGTMTDQNRVTVKLSNLSEGLYTFKVAVSSLNAYGEAYANVSVLPRKCH